MYLYTLANACKHACVSLYSIFHFYSYGLLGASGCGKTTLLRCVLGRLRIQSGKILILGKPPGAKGHNVPGNGVGYMPQVSIIQGNLIGKNYYCLYRRRH